MTKKTHAVGIIFEDEEGEILALKRHIDEPEGGKWGLVGGKIDKYENNLLAAKREVKEEIGCGIDISKLDHLKTYNWNKKDLTLIFDVFKVNTKRDKIKITLDENENTDYVWIYPNKLYKKTNLMKGLYPILKDHYKVT